MRTIRRVLGLVTPLALACAAVAGPASAAPARPLTGAAQAGPLAAPVASLVDDIAPGPLSSDPRDLTAMNGELFFSARDRRHGRQLWKSDGTAAGTVMLTDVAAPFGADPQDLAVADGELFFSAWDPRHGRELWKSDGTAAGTTLVSFIWPAQNPDLMQALAARKITVLAMDSLPRLLSRAQKMDALTSMATTCPRRFSRTRSTSTLSRVR